MVEVEPPVAGPDEVVLQVAACGICGSELETFKNHSDRRTPPLVMGHEFCGTIASVGANVNDWQAGDRVVSNSLVPCMKCVRCQRGDTHLCADRQIFGMHRPGAFAEQVAVPANCLITWPEDLDADAACLAEPVANGVHMVNLTAHLPSQTVLVIGAGPIGLMALQAFKALRDSQVWVADLQPERLKVAQSLGAAGTINVGEENTTEIIQKATEGEGADIVIDAVGSGATNVAALEAVRPGGAVVVIGLHEDSRSFDSYKVTLPEKQVIGTYAATLDELKQALSLLHSGKVETGSWVQTFPLEDGVEAFQRVLAAQDKDIKAVLIP